MFGIADEALGNGLMAATEPRREFPLTDDS
jgi:hypothetical protein